MVVYRFEGEEPKIGEGTYVSQSAGVIGDIIVWKTMLHRTCARTLTSSDK